MLGGGAVETESGAGAHAVRSVVAIERQRRRPDERCELSRRTAPHEVHLEEALLGVDEAEGACEIQASVTLKRRNPIGVAPDLDRSVETFEAERPVGRRQARPQEPIDRAAGDDGHGDHEDPEPLHPPHGF